VAKQPWDASVQALAGLPDVVKHLADDIQWTTDLGNAFLAQQNDLMESVQRMRKKAEGTGNLKSSDQQKVETKVVENKSVIVIGQANPQVVYVPSYNPTVVYGAPVYPYPPIYYPPPGYYAAGMAISFGIGVAMGAFWGGWGWGCGWGGNNDITVNRNNNFNRNTNINGGNRPSQLPSGGGAGDRWQHNPQHRGGAPYRDRATADRFGGSARGDSLTNRQSGARQQIGRQGGNLPSNRGGAGAGNRASNTGLGDRGGGAGVSNRAAGGGANSIGSRDLSRSGGGNRDAFGGGNKGFNGASARATSSRGASSMGARGQWWGSPWRRGSTVEVWNEKHRSTEMKSPSANKSFSGFARVVVAIAWACLSVPLLLTAQPAAKGPSPASTGPATPAAVVSSAQTFDIAEQAVDALVGAAEQFDTTALIQIFGPEGDDIVFSGEVAQDRQRAIDFAGMAHEKKSIAISPKNGTRAFLLVGDEDWPFPVPLVKGW